MVKIILNILLMLVFISSICPALPAQTKVDKVYIGVVYPRTGAQARHGETCTQACILAAEDVNKAGGIKSLGGAKIELIIADARSDVSVTRSEVERLCTRYKLSALTGAYVSGLTLPATEVSERYKIPWITGSIADAITGRGFKYVFQVSPKASHFGHMQVALAKELGEKVGPPAKKVAIVYEDTAYGTATSRGLMEKSKELGFETVMYEAYKHGFTDAAPLVTKIKASGAEILFPVSYLTDAILIIRTMREMKVNAAVIGGGAGYLMPEFEKGLGKDAEYVFSVGSWNWDLPYPEVTDMARRYEERHGEFIQEHAGEAYCMIWILADAIERAKSTDPQKIRDALAKTNLTKGPGAIMPGYHVEFDATGWNKHVHPVMVQWQKGKLRSVWPPKVASTKPVWPVPPWDKR
ncbi:MAG: ABC transporter substrate-binding protein [Thermodesulfobacteriota bacterium]